MKRKLTAVLLILTLVMGTTGCGETSTAENDTTGASVSADNFDSAGTEAYKKYLEERENVGDLYFSCLYIGKKGEAVLAITHEKNAVDKETDYITASHIVLNNYVDKKVVQVAGSSMDSYSNTSKVSFLNGKMWVPVYGGASCYTVSDDKIEGEVYATEAGTSTKYSVTGKKRTEPETVEESVVQEMTNQQNQTAIPVKFYKNTAENREKYL